jgi:hypothetical protein
MSSIVDSAAIYVMVVKMWNSTWPPFPAVFPSYTRAALTTNSNGTQSAHKVCTTVGIPIPPMCLCWHCVLFCFHFIETSETDHAVSLRPQKYWQKFSCRIRGIRHEKLCGSVSEQPKYVNKIENFCHISRGLNETALKPISRSHWDCGIWFRGLIETAGSELCKRLSQFSQQKRSHMQNGSRPWIRALGWIVWWTKPRVENLVTLSL